MFRITKKIVIAASIVALYSEQFVAFGSNNNIAKCDRDGKLVETIEVRTNAAPLELNNDNVTVPPATELIQYSNHKLHLLDQPLFTRIMEDVSPHMNPAIFRQVCKRFKYLLDMENNPNAQSKLHQQGLLMQKCLKTWWSIEDPRRFNSGILRCTLPQSGELIDLKFADLDATNGIFALPAVLADRFRVMKNVSEFFRISEEDSGSLGGKILILAVLHSDAENAARSMNADHPFVKVVKEWDVSKAAVGFFFRSGNVDAKQNGFNYVTTQSLTEVSQMKSLYILLAKKQVCILGGIIFITARLPHMMQCLFSDKGA